MVGCVNMARKCNLTYQHGINLSCQTELTSQTRFHDICHIGTILEKGKVCGFLYNCINIWGGNSESISTSEWHMWVRSSAKYPKWNVQRPIYIGVRGDWAKRCPPFPAGQNCFDLKPRCSSPPCCLSLCSLIPCFYSSEQRQKHVPPACAVHLHHRRLRPRMEEFHRQP